jgi:hypothetical protein
MSIPPYKCVRLLCWNYRLWEVGKNYFRVARKWHNVHTKFHANPPAALELNRVDRETGGRTDMVVPVFVISQTSCKEYATAVVQPQDSTLVIPKTVIGQPFFAFLSYAKPSTNGPASKENFFTVSL